MTNLQASIRDELPQTTDAAVKTMWKDTPTRTVDVGGVKFAYRQLGADAGVPLVFLHHLTAVLDDWDPRVIDGIAAKRRVITFDNRGIGATGGSVPHTAEAMARDAVAFIRALGLERVDLLGFSLGGGVAQVIAMEEPDLIRKLILAGTGPAGGGGIDDITKIAVGAYIKAALTLRDPRHYLFFTRTPDGKRAAKDYIARLKERTDDRDKRITPLAMRAQLKAIRAFGTQKPHDLTALRQPVLVANGDQDAMVASSHFGGHSTTPAGRGAQDLPQLRAWRRLPAPSGVRRGRAGVPRAMKHYNGPSGWISATIKPPKPGGLGWKINTAITRMHVRIFQRTGGRVGGTLDGAPLLILHHTGAKTAARRQNPTVYMPDGENLVIVASIGGNPKNPAWYHNLRAHPDDVEVDVRGGRRRVRARKATAEEAAELWPRLVEAYPPFQTYMARTERELPVMILEPRR